MSIVSKEREQLQKQLSNEPDCPETCFIEQAIGLLDERFGLLTNKMPPELAQAEQDTENVSNKTEQVPNYISPVSTVIE